MEARTWHIYALVDPREPEVIRYIGKTYQRPSARLSTHVREAKRRSRRNHRLNWILGLLRLGVTPQLNVLFSGRNSDWVRAERAWIAVCRAAGLPLVNGTDGGDGFAGQHSPQTKERIRRSVLEQSARPVVCVETGEQFPSATAAARANGSASLGGLGYSLRTGHRYKGMHWRYADRDPVVSVSKRERPVRCVETGQRFESGQAAANSVGRSKSAIRVAIREQQCSGGYHWEYTA